MRTEIAFIDALNEQDLEAASQLLGHTDSYPVACNNWAKNYPYAPEVRFHMAHNGKNLFIQFVVREDCTMAKVTEDNGEVYTDSCVEFFLAPDDSGYYYNFEFSCIGKALLGFRKGRAGAIHAPADKMVQIKRHSSLGTENFEEKNGTNTWELVISIPVQVLFRHQLDSWKGLTMKANAYKCGDNLSKPHYLSWQPIHTPQPDFHVPEYFTEIYFQES